MVPRSIYNREGTGVLIDIDVLGHEEAFARSAAFLRSGEVPLFEAGMKAGGAHAYADVMLPDHRDGALAWKMIEVKSSGNVKDYQHDDIAMHELVPKVRPLTGWEVTWRLQGRRCQMIGKYLVWIG